MKNYYRLMLGRKSAFAEECFKGNFVGVDLSIEQDLTGSLPEDWRQFNQKVRPVFLKKHPDKSKISAGLACGFLWTVAKGIREGDILLCPDGTARYHVAEVTGGYYYQPGTSLPHCRNVQWLEPLIDRSEMSQALQNSTGSIGTVSDITKHAAEIDRLIAGKPAPLLVSNDETEI